MPPLALCALADDAHAADVVAVGCGLGSAGAFTPRFVHVAPWHVAIDEGFGVGARLAARLHLRHEMLELQAGPAAVEVRRRADELGAALVVVGSRGRGRLAAVLTASMFRSLLAHGKRPVVIARGGTAVAAPGPVVCGITGPRERATHLARAAAGLARRMDRGLVLAACDPDLGADELEQLARWQRVPGDALPAIVDGSSPRGLVALARARGAPLLVVGSRVGGPLDRRVAPGLIRDAGRPVVIVPVGGDREPAE